ncbi:MAG: SpoIIE family protein phosphatase [Chloroflexi bacterium]|nr:SpoIIE family protein phosphatase [Chloroflexota bacterium]
MATQRAHFAALAEAWLMSGAEAFMVTVEGFSLASWPPFADAETATLIGNLWDGHAKIGELRVVGPNDAAAWARLKTEANLVSTLIRSTSNLQSVTAELVDTQDQLLAMYDLTQAMREQLDLNKVLQRLAGETARLIKADAAFLMVQRSDESWFIQQYPGPTLDLTTLEHMLNIIQETGQDLLLGEEDVEGQGEAVRNLLLMPIRLHDSTRAALGVANKTEGDFLSPDIKLARAIADHAGARIENALLYRENLEQAKLQTEMELAQRVQLNLLPHGMPAVIGIDFWAGSRPALQVGGDFYDFLQLDGRPFIFTVGDISGKGLPAAILMAMTRTVIRSNVHGSFSLTPELVVGRSNEELYDDFTEVSMFATVFVGQYQPQTREMVYANAGHSPVIYCPAGGNARLLEADGTAVGILPTSFSENQRLVFAPGDVLIVATDGLSEAHNEHEEMFGYDRLLTLIESLAEKSAREIAEGLYRSVNAFSAGRPQDDDQTVLVLKGVAV